MKTWIQNALGAYISRACITALSESHSTALVMSYWFESSDWRCKEYGADCSSQNERKDQTKGKGKKQNILRRRAVGCWSVIWRLAVRWTWQAYRAGKQADRQCTVQEFSTAEQGFSNFFLAYHCNNTKHASLPLGTANINDYFQNTGLPGCFAVETSNFAVAVFLI